MALFLSTIDHSHCIVTPADDSIIPATVSAAAATENFQQFYIKIEAEFLYPPHHNDDDEEEELDFTLFESDDCTKEFSVPCDVITRSTHSSWAAISGFLSQTGVPKYAQPDMIHRIASCAQETAAAEHYVGRKVLPMVVSLSCVVVDSQDLQEDGGDGLREDFAASMEGDGPVPARAPAVAALEKVRVLENVGEGME